MGKKLKLSIIIVNYNTESFLIDCLKSIYSAPLLTSQFEVIVIDNHSKRNSVPLIRDFIGQQKLLNIKVLENKKNIGFARANNIGVVKSLGQYILFLNPDTELLPDTLSVMLDYMDKNQEVGVATCKVILLNGQIDDACHRGFPTPWNAFCHFSRLSKLFPSSQFFNGYHRGFREMDKIHEIDAGSGAFMLVRRAAGFEVGWFDEDYFWYGEDLDFCYRIKEKGWKIAFVPSTKITHLKGVSSGIKNHSRDISTATRKIQMNATKARFEVMRIFYNKHYQDKYPLFLREIVMTGVKIMEWFSLSRYKYYANRN